MGGFCVAINDLGPLEHTSATLVRRRPNSAGSFGVRGATQRLPSIDPEPGDRRQVEREPGPVQLPELFSA